jgi:hypothetical protein
LGTSVGAAGASPAFSFSQHGPFHRLQRRVGLLAETDPGIARRVAFFTLIAWLPIVLLAVLQGYALNEHHGRAVLLDFSAYAFLIAVATFVLMEQTSDKRMA